MITVFRTHIHQCRFIGTGQLYDCPSNHDDVIKWKHFPRYWPFVRGIHRSPVNSPHKGQWRGALMFSLICVWINGWVNNRKAGDLRRYRSHYDVTVMQRQWSGCKGFWLNDQCQMQLFFNWVVRHFIWNLCGRVPGTIVRYACIPQLAEMSIHLLSTQVVGINVHTLGTCMTITIIGNIYAHYGALGDVMSILNAGRAIFTNPRYSCDSACCLTRHLYTLRPEQNGRHFAYEIFKWMLLRSTKIFLCVTKAKVCTDTLNVNHCHRLWEIPAIIGIKRNTTTFDYVCRLILNMFYCARGRLNEFNHADVKDVR